MYIYLQIVKAVLERQRLSAASEQALQDNEDENVKEFLSLMFSRGQRYMHAWTHTHTHIYL